MQPSSIKFYHAIVCEDIRTEKNGKHIFIGVYGSSILVKEFPATLVLHFAVPCASTEAFKTQIEFRVKYGDKLRMTGSGDIQVHAPGDSLLLLPRVVIERLDHPDVLYFSVRAEKGRWQTIRSIPIQLQQAPD